MSFHNLDTHLNVYPISQEDHLKRSCCNTRDGSIQSHCNEGVCYFAMIKMRECFKISIMGCLPSRRREPEESQATADTNSISTRRKGDDSQRQSNITSQGENSTMAPTIQMVNPDTLKLLQEIGELKVYQIASNADHRKHIDLHQDIIFDLENPTKASCPVTPLPGAPSTNVK